MDYEIPKDYTIQFLAKLLIYDFEKLTYLTVLKVNFNHFFAQQV